jgi:GTP-binding protein
MNPSNGIVAIIGRPNVGKSTLFNRLVEQRQAIVDNAPGITRDRLYGVCEWNGRRFSVIDTGGYVPESDDLFEAAIREQVEIALDQADVVLFVTDITEGIHHSEETIADVVRRHGKSQVIVVANKTDTYDRAPLAAEFYKLGLENLHTISAISGSGTGDLLDAVVQALPPPDPAAENLEAIPKLAIVGRPNVGKSSLVNALLGHNAHIVTPIAGTTRDSLMTRYKAFGFDYFLLDTAGLRKKAKINDNVEFYSTLRTLRAIDTCDLAVLMIDATVGIEGQDLAILRTIAQQRKGLIIAANKWDLVDKSIVGADRILYQAIEQRIAPLSHVPILLISATEKIRIHKLMETVRQVVEARNRHISTRELNETLMPLIEQTPPQTSRGRRIRIKHITQVKGRVPSFVFFTNHPDGITENYRRFLTNLLRREYGFEGWPISLFFRES